AGAEIITDLLINGFASTLLRRLLQNVALNGQVARVDFREANPPRLVGGDLSVLQPVAAGILIKINAGVGSLINVGNAEAGRRRGRHRGRRLSETGDGRKQQKNECELGWMHSNASRSGVADGEFYSPPIGRANRAEVTALFSGG